MPVEKKNSVIPLWVDVLSRVYQFQNQKDARLEWIPRDGPDKLSRAMLYRFGPEAMRWIDEHLCGKGRVRWNVSDEENDLYLHVLNREGDKYQLCDFVRPDAHKLFKSIGMHIQRTYVDSQHYMQKLAKQQKP